jgi:hypothetical protein
MIPAQVIITAAKIAQALTGLLLIVAALGLAPDIYLLKYAITIGFVVFALYVFYMRYPWIAFGMVACAVVFNPFAPFAFPRHVWAILDVLALGALVYATYWTTNPHQKGTRFEHYVSSLFPEPEFVLETRTRDISKFSKRRVESDMHPDLLFRNQKTGSRFAVECKWRGAWAGGKSGEPGIWWNISQAARYRTYALESQIPVYVAFGVGGIPEKPKEIYVLPLESLRWPFLKQSFIRDGDRYST